MYCKDSYLFKIKLIMEVKRMESVSTAITALLNIVSTMLDTILGNPVLAVIFASGFVGIAISVLRKLLRTRA